MVAAIVRPAPGPCGYAFIGLIANLEYRGYIYNKMSKNADWRGKTKPIMAQLPFLHSTNIPQA